MYGCGDRFLQSGGVMGTTDYDEINQHIDDSVIYHLKYPHGPQTIDRERKLVGTTPAGYLGQYEYLGYCDDVAATFNSKSGNSLRFSKNWKTQHGGETVEGFIAEATNEAVAQAREGGVG
jgi:hypothetical protein